MGQDGIRNVALFGEQAEAIIHKVAQLSSCSVSSAEPDALVVYGGDGTILRSEQVYPGVPKICFRDAAGCKACTKKRGAKQKQQAAFGSGRWYCERCFSKVMAAALAGDFEVRDETKLLGKASKQGQDFSIEALNEVQLHCANPWEAARFSLKLNGKEISKEVIADGVLCCTPYGSTGYFHSVTRKRFSKGIGVAVINPTIPVKSFVVAKNLGRFRLSAALLRGPAILAADNNPKIAYLGAKDAVEITKSKNVARFVTV